MAKSMCEQDLSKSLAVTSIPEEVALEASVPMAVPVPQQV